MGAGPFLLLLPTAIIRDCSVLPAESKRRIAMHLGMWDDLYSAASLAPLARQVGAAPA